LKAFCISLLYLCKPLRTYEGREEDILYIRSFTYVHHIECVEAGRWEVAYILHIRDFTYINHIEREEAVR
jgi:hypothetical protein